MLSFTTDAVIFAATNCLLYLRHPRFVLRYFGKQRQWPNLACPSSMAELIQWRKLFDRNPVFPVFADKLRSKDWAKQRCPELGIPETLWVGDRPEDIPDDLVGPDVVIKTNNASSQNFFPERERMSRLGLNKTVRRWLAGRLRSSWREFRKGTREWASWPVERKLFVERLVRGKPLVDISVRASDGVGFLVTCATDFKTEASRVGFFWPDGTRINYGAGPSGLDSTSVVPSHMRRAIACAADLSLGFDYLRIDFLAVDEGLYLSEITLYPASGYGHDDWWSVTIYRFWMAAIDKSWPLSTPQPWPRSIYLAAFRRWAVARAAELGPPQDFLVAERAMQEGR